MKWEYKGVPLNPPHVIILRLLLYPFLQISRILMVTFVFIGWGMYDAKRIWDETA